MVREIRMITWCYYCVSLWCVSVTTVSAFSPVISSTRAYLGRVEETRALPLAVRWNSNRDDDEDDFVDEDPREYARVRGRRGRGREWETNDNDRQSSDEENSNNWFDRKVYPRRSTDTTPTTPPNEDVYLEEEEDDFWDDEDDEDEDDDDELEVDEYTGIIPNPVLDSIDPDGAYERMGELFTDVTFWRDLAIFLSFMGWLYAINASQLPLIDGPYGDAFDF
jgi:hypothetical protein|mmetsp:Transcript_13306/g.24123  ORF Transcript_13306/g.24123 Transcript_13306/m.24123 type:complete len:222 (-) Transcript_13306:328-993(-)|eukprot:CAMPEP_0198294758 /NCGR_PEP_ID=MMETSP1449-20131203/24161_1 /TAXON_ID=420275 /ORGANISM="Attheya septentrionalis, Strain CCMP2084" /LENGTH=221 /DNA_ID=CAMNT_0043994817 /DNA_START=192 /DNA_END=857 /DNA_ORIENTATION=-